MKQELVAYRDIYGNWCCVFNVSLSEQTSTKDEMIIIEIIKNNYPFLSNNNFIINEREIFVLTDEFDMINPGIGCPI